MADLKGCFERIKRANVHIGSLKRGRVSFINRSSHALEIERNMQVVPWELTLYATPSREIPPTFGSLVGDVVNNLRAALDQLVWELSDLKSGPPPPDPIPWDDRWRRISFPIVLDEKKWPKIRKKRLWAVDPGLLADFEGLQPFRRRKRAPHRDEFAVLDELWSIDKHRHPHIVYAFIGLHSLAPVAWPWPEDPNPPPMGFDFEILEQRPIGPFEGRTKLGVVRQVRVNSMPPGGIITTSYPEMHVNLRLAFDIAFEKGPPAYGGRVIQTLEACRDAVAEALVRFEPEFR